MGQKLLGSLKNGIVFVLSAPAGTGKTTLVRMLTEEFPSVVESISYTTRKMRPNEIEGRDYHFIGRSEFEKRVRQGDFLEHAEVFGELYGTSKSAVEFQQQAGKHVVLVIDTQGAMQLMGRMDGVFIFLSPPDIQELKRRLSKRKSESPDKIEERLSWAKKEMETSDRYDYQIINDDLETAYAILRAVLIAEEHRTRQRKKLI